MSASEGFLPFVQRLENSNWIYNYMFFIRRTILSGSNYQVVRCFPDIPDASYGDKFLEFVGLDGFTTLSSRIFWWLINIWPEYRSSDKVMYARLNPICPVSLPGNLDMIKYISKIQMRAFALARIYLKVPGCGSLAGGRGAIFSLTHKTPNSYMSLGFCMWYIIANTVSSFGINTSCIKAIKSMYNARRGPNASRIQEMNEYLEAKKEAGRYEVA